MELIYLWVEKYNNIKEQGFNFSPRFTCEYKDENLTIKPKEHIENFFDEKGKINITAIVGENGSGKSSILEIIIKILKNEMDKKYILVKGDKTYLTNIKDLPKVDEYTHNKDYKINTCYFKYNNKHENNFPNNHLHTMLLDTQSIGNAIAKNYDEDDKKFKLSSFMLIPKKVKIELKADSTKKDLKNDGINLATPITIKEFITNKDLYITEGKGDYKHLIFDFIDIEGRKYSDLSHGEQTIYGQLLQIYFYIKSEKDFLFLFDEPEISLHPNWQKGYMNEILTLLQNAGGKNHFIFTSHSPFLLSDIPKQNIIFLDKYDNESEKYPNLNLKNLENGNCINVSSEIDIKPFGANIHELLSHGFFMKDSLMGEFALDKIQKIVKFYNDVKDGSKKKEDYTKKIKKEFYFIRDNIGEEYIKDVITNHIEYIEEKLGDTSFKDRQIKQLEQELKKLKANNDKD